MAFKEILAFSYLQFIFIYINVYTFRILSTVQGSGANKLNMEI